MSNQEQLKVGDRVMLLPGVRPIGTPFSIGVIHERNTSFCIVNLDDGDLLGTRLFNIQPLPTKFDGWEEE